LDLILPGCGIIRSQESEERRKSILIYKLKYRIMKWKLSILMCLLTTVVLITTFAFRLPNDPWPVPEKYEKMKNPVKSDAESIATGKSLWNKHCVSCHGKTGMGDGTKAATLKTHPGDFSKPEFKAQSDGAVFYKTTEGRKDMPSFKKKITDEDDVWSLINYIRTLK
jgi:mono/diheme cytochrome c family protein